MTFLKKYRFTFLLSSLLLLLVIIPVIDHFKLIGMIFNIFLSYTLITSILALSNKRSLWRVSLVLASPYFIMNWVYEYHSTSVFIERLDLISGIIFFSFVTVALLYAIVDTKQIALEKIFAAMSAYLLIGIAWSFIFALIHSFQPGSFNNIPPELFDPRIRFTYFSFVTLTTLGYGDIIPMSAVAQAWAILEAIIGQFYLVVVISGLVGIFISKNLQPSSD